MLPAEGKPTAMDWNARPFVRQWFGHRRRIQRLSSCRAELLARRSKALGEAVLPNRHACEQTDNTEFATGIGSFNGQAPAETAPSVRLLVNFQLRQPDAALVWVACGNLIA